MVRATLMGAMVFAAMALSIGCGSAQAQVRETWDKVKNYTLEKKDAAVDLGKELVRETDAKIKELEEKAKDAKGDAKEAYERSLRELKAKRADADEKLRDMDKSTDSAWDATRKGFADAYDDLQESYKKAVEYFRK